MRDDETRLELVDRESRDQGGRSEIEEEGEAEGEGGGGSLERREAIMTSTGLAGSPRRVIR